MCLFPCVSMCEYVYLCYYSMLQFNDYIVYVNIDNPTNNFMLTIVLTLVSVASK